MTGAKRGECCSSGSATTVRNVYGGKRWLDKINCPKADEGNAAALVVASVKNVAPHDDVLVTYVRGKSCADRTSSAIKAHRLGLAGLRVQ